MTIHKPKWFSDETVMISTAATCGLTKGGRLLPKIDPQTGKRIQTVDPETGGLIDAIDDELLVDMEALRRGQTTSTLTFVPSNVVNLRCAVPIYYDRRYHGAFAQAMQTPKFTYFKSARIGHLIESGVLAVRNGHGSPSQDQRVGTVPYIKVSDLRAGLVNVNPTNRVPISVARQFWGGPSSGLRAFDLVCPERTSKNIGDFCVLMPGQEQVVMTKEVIVLRPGPNADFDPFYLLWAMSLKIVRDQWRRVIFMQTNREDVGGRYHEIEIPLAPDSATAAALSEAFRNYYTVVATARENLAAYLSSDGAHHFYITGAEAPDLTGGSGTEDEDLRGVVD
jgi:type I restriction enzyme M protein